MAHKGISVGQRLALLVMFQVGASLLCLILSVVLLGQIVTDQRYMYEYQLTSLAEIGDALGKAGRLHGFGKDPETHLTQEDVVKWQSFLKNIESFEERYREEWWNETGSSDYAKLFRKDLVHSGENHLLREENEILEQLSATLSRLRLTSSEQAPRYGDIAPHVYEMRNTLVSLLTLNTKFAAIANDQVTRRTIIVKSVFIGLSALACVTALVFGLAVRRAIVPRIQRLVEKTKRFKEGVNEHVDDPGADEIAILANALNIGFDSIADRERDRQKFMAIAAHELKTPVNSIHGFVTYMLKHKEDKDGFDQALDIVSRQSWRLSRLIEDLFIAARASLGTLPFQPTSVELSQLVRRVIQEVNPILNHKSFDVTSTPVFLLADESLVSHALWSFLTYAASLAPKDQAVQVHVEQNPTKACVRAFVPGAHVPQAELNGLTIPFQTLEFEGTGTRLGISLYLTHEIAKLHHGSLDIRNQFEKGVELALELPA